MKKSLFRPKLGRIEIQGTAIDVNNSPIVNLPEPTETHHAATKSYCDANASDQPITASYYLSANFAASASVPINYNTMIYDARGIVTPSATDWRATVPAGGAGKYRVTFMNVVSFVSVYMILWKNGAEFKRLAYTNWGSNMLTQATTVDLIAGDYIQIRPSAAFTATGGTLSAGAVWIDIERLSD